MYYLSIIGTFATILMALTHVVLLCEEGGLSLFCCFGLELVTDKVESFELSTFLFVAIIIWCKYLQTDTG